MSLKEKIKDRWVEYLIGIVLLCATAFGEKVIDIFKNLLAEANNER